MKRTLAVLLVLGLAPLLASAASISWTAQYVTTYSGTDFYDPNLTDLGPQFTLQADGTTLKANNAINPNWVSAFNVSFKVTGLQAGEDVKQVAADLLIGAGLTPVQYDPTAGQKFSFNTYETVNWQVWQTVPPPAKWVPVSKPTFASTGDSGTPDDLLGLQGQISNDVAYRGQVAETSAELLGTVYVKWNGTQTTLTAKEAGGLGSASWIYYTGNQTGTGTQITTVTNTAADSQTVLTLVPTPEPITMALLAVGGIGMIVRRRR